MDPFCGTGTTLVESRKLGFESIGIEPAPMAHFASTVKLDWSPDPDELLVAAHRIAQRATAAGTHVGDGALLKLPPEVARLLIRNSISPLPLHRTLVLSKALADDPSPHARRHLRLALATALVKDIGNLSFGPEVGVKRQKQDAPVVDAWLAQVRGIALDLHSLPHARQPGARVLNRDARDAFPEIESESVDAVITSPPYPNEKDYTRTTRLESVLLGFLKNSKDLRATKKRLIRSNTRGVYRDDDDEKWVRDHSEIQEIAHRIEQRRIELGKTSGFERAYARVTLHYFGGMARHLAATRRVLRPGALAAYVVGDQASFLRVMIRTGKLLGSVAESLGYDVIRRDLFRTRMATATRAMLREEVLVLRRR